MFIFLLSTRSLPTLETWSATRCSETENRPKTKAKIYFSLLLCRATGEGEGYSQKHRVDSVRPASKSFPRFWSKTFSWPSIPCFGPTCLESSVTTIFDKSLGTHCHFRKICQGNLSLHPLPPPHQFNVVSRNEVVNACLQHCRGGIPSSNDVMRCKCLVNAFSCYLI